MVVAYSPCGNHAEKKIRSMVQRFGRALGLCNSPCGIHAGLYELQEVLATLGTLVSKDIVGQHVSDDVQATFCTLVIKDCVGQQVL